MTTIARKNKKKVKYSKWGYIFIAPFFVIYLIFSFFPLVSTFYNSFFENYRVGLTQVGPTFVGLKNFETLFSNADLLQYLGNTAIMWVWGFVPQIVIALALALLFTNMRLKIKNQQFFKTVIYMPNLIMASAFAMLFFALFSDGGPVNQILMSAGIIAEPFRFLTKVGASRGLVALMNFLMWFGNTTILLMAGILGIDQSLFESAEIDGASATQIFKSIILPLLMPILIYVVITSMIGGIQMFDVPQILTNGGGSPNRSTMTLIMFLNKHLTSKNYGLAGATSVIVFAITAVLSITVYRMLQNKSKSVSK